MRIEWTFQRNTAFLSGFYSVKNNIFVQNTLFKWKDEGQFLLWQNHKCYKQEGQAPS